MSSVCVHLSEIYATRAMRWKCSSVSCYKKLSRCSGAPAAKQKFAATIRNRFLACHAESYPDTPSMMHITLLPIKENRCRVFVKLQLQLCRNGLAFLLVGSGRSQLTV